MLSTDEALFSALIVAILPVCLALAAILIARSARTYARSCTSWLEKFAAQREPKSEIAKLSAELTELTDSYNALLKSHKKLRSRISMRENRERKAGDSVGDELGSETDKKALRIAAKQSGLLK